MTAPTPPTGAAPAATPIAVGAPKQESVRQFPCKQCGANLSFAPGTTKLVCPYCGHAEEVPVTAEQIREYALDDALLTLPQTRGSGTETRSIRLPTWRILLHLTRQD